MDADDNALVMPQYSGGRSYYRCVYRASLNCVEYVRMTLRHINSLCTSKDCKKDCGSWGTLVSCTVCQCNGSVFDGRVVYSYNGTRHPLADVKVYVVGREWKEWKRSNPDGRFRLVLRSGIKWMVV